MDEIKKKEIVSLSQSRDEVYLESSDEEEQVTGRKLLLRQEESVSIAPRNILNQRVLLITSRGITYRFRHLMQDLNDLMPHSKKDAKLDSKARLEDINEVAELNNCNGCLYFEVRKHKDMYMWMTRTPNGPSVKFMVRNVHTMDELKMTGNCLKGSRPLLSFDGMFDKLPHLQLLKEMFTMTYGVPKRARKMKPFIDHVMSFSVLDGKIWIRNYQIIEPEVETEEMSLVEIGPRYVLEIMRIFDGAFGGSTLYENADFITPNNVRRTLKGKSALKHIKRTEGVKKREIKLKRDVIQKNEIDSIYDN